MTVKYEKQAARALVGFAVKGIFAGISFGLQNSGNRSTQKSITVGSILWFFVLVALIGAIFYPICWVMHWPEKWANIGSWLVGLAIWGHGRLWARGDGSGLPGSSRIKRKTLAGTDEGEAKQVVKQLAEAAKSSAPRRGRAGVTVRRTSDGKGDVVVPWPLFFAGTLVVGASGSGKSSGILYPMLEEILAMPNVCRMVLDAKGDYTSMLFKRERKESVDPSLSDIALKPPAFLLNPSDRDSLQFKLEVNNAKEAAKLAEIFIRKDKTDQAYFVDTARNVFAGLLLGLKTIGQLNWHELFHVIADGSIDDIRDILALTNQGKLSLSDLSPDSPAQTAGILSSMKKEVMFLASIADVWTDPQFSVAEFIRNAYQTVILRNDTQDVLSQKMVQIFVEMAFTEIAALPDYNDNTYILFADELSNAPMMNLTFSTSFLRSKNLAHVLSFQDVDRMREIYGEKNFNTIFENCATKIILKSGTETAEWFSKSFGDRVILQESTSSNRSMTSLQAGSSTHENYVTERTINMGRIIALPPANGQAVGLFATQGVNVTELAWDQSLCKLKDMYKPYIEADWVRVW
jgi:hypothetical protein